MAEDKKSGRKGTKAESASAAGAGTEKERETVAETAAESDPVTGESINEDPTTGPTGEDLTDELADWAAEEVQVDRDADLGDRLYEEYRDRQIDDALCWGGLDR